MNVINPYELMGIDPNNPNLTKLKVSRNKTYIVSDDCKQSLVYEKYQYYINKKIKIINIPKKFLKFFINLLPWPKKISNFFKIISNSKLFSFFS